MGDYSGTNNGGTPLGGKFSTVEYGIAPPEGLSKEMLTGLDKNELMDMIPKETVDISKRKIVKGFRKMKYAERAKDPRVIEIKIIRRKHEEPHYLKGEFEPPDGYHYYIFYAKRDKIGKPEMLKELTKVVGRDNFFNGDEANNSVNSIVYPGQMVKWICLYPFTIYYGGNSIITTDEHGFPRPRQIIPYLKAKREEFKTDKDDYELKEYYATPDAWIVYNALSGAYKYFVSVYIPRNVKDGGDIICVDDPQDHVPPPREP